MDEYEAALKAWAATMVGVQDATIVRVDLDVVNGPEYGEETGQGSAEITLSVLWEARGMARRHSSWDSTDIGEVVRALIEHTPGAAPVSEETPQ